MPRKFLIVSHTPTATTGYGRVTRRLAQASAKPAIKWPSSAPATTAAPTSCRTPSSPYPDLSPAPIAAAIRDLAPDILLTIGDPWMFDSLPPLTSSFRRCSSPCPPFVATSLRRFVALSLPTTPAGPIFPSTTLTNP